MRKLMMLAALMVLPSMAQAQAPVHELDLGAVECNWGVLTMRAFLFEDFDVGTHSADPDEDGIGRDDPDRTDPRVGLPRLSPDGMEGVCLLVGCLLIPEDPICS